MLTRLKGKKTIENLFTNGFWIRTKWLGICVLPIEKETLPDVKKIAFGVAVPKKHMSKAVDRNLLKRRMRVVFKNQHHLFLTTENDRFLIMLCYFHKKIMSSKKIAQEQKTLAKKFHREKTF